MLQKERSHNRATVEVSQGKILRAPGTTAMSYILILHAQCRDYPLPWDLFEITGNSETSFTFTQQQSRRPNRDSRDWPWKRSHLHHSPSREMAQHSRAAFELVQPILPSQGQKSHHVLEAALSPDLPGGLSHQGHLNAKQKRHQTHQTDTLLHLATVPLSAWPQPHWEKPT